MSSPVPLIRRFTTIPDRARSVDADLDETWLRHGRGEQVDWGHLRSQFRAVILADAGAGKTFELMAEAQNLVDGGRAAFFVRIENIDGDFGSAFEIGTQQTFERWLNSSGEAWFFLDSVDEVRLETPRAFEVAMRAFAARIQHARHRAHVFISCRPYAWRSKLDGALIVELLPHAPAYIESGGVEAKISDAELNKSLPLYYLDPLDRDQIRIFAAHRDVPDISNFLGAIDRNSIYRLAQLPFSLEDLIFIWNRTGDFDSRLAVLERGLRHRLSAACASQYLLPLDRALKGARRLALATTLMAEANIRLPGARSAGIDASTVLNGWSREEVCELLSRGVFSDAIYSIVRFRHREVRELLAAQELAEALRRPEARPGVEALIFRKIYGETVVVPRLRPLLPWLILFDHDIRDRTLNLQTEIAIEGGDPAQLPLATRAAILRDIVDGIISGANRGGSNIEIARIAQPDLEDTVLSIFDAYSGDDRIIFFLGRLVWQGNMCAAARRLRPIATDASRDIYARIVSIRAIMNVGRADEQDTLWAALRNAAEPLPHRLLAEIVDNAPASTESVDRIVESLEKLEPYARLNLTGFDRALHGFIDRLPMARDSAVERPLVQLVAGLTRYLFREPFVHQGRECRVAQAYAWLMAPALHAVERLIIGRSGASLDLPALDIMAQAFTIRHCGGFEDGEYKTKLADLVPRWIELNDALFWHSVTWARWSQRTDGETITDYWKVDWPGHFWRFDEASFTRTLEWVRMRELDEDRSLALSLNFQLYVQGGRSRRWRDALRRAVKDSPALDAKLSILLRPPSDPDRKLWRADERRWARRRRMRNNADERARARFVSKLKADPEDIRNPPGLTRGEISQGQFYLLDTMKGAGLRFSRTGGGGWRALIPEFGETVAEAFRDAAIRHWRAFEPGLRSEGVDGTSVPIALIFALTGLDIEAEPDGRGLEVLSESDARHAMRYALWEINGFPGWFESLFRRYRQVGVELVLGEVRWELANSSPDKPMHYILHDIVYHAPWLHADLAAPICSWLLDHGAPHSDALRYARVIMVGGGLPPETIAALAQVRAKISVTPETQLPTWFALWVDTDPTHGIEALDVKLSSLDSTTGTTFAMNFLGALLGDRRGGGAVIGAWQTTTDLRRLYILMQRHISVADDIDRSEGGVFSPTERDDAQRARDHLFALLTDIPGEPTYREIRQLATDHPDIEYRSYMRRAARDRATADSERTWSERETIALLDRLSGPR